MSNLLFLSRHWFLTTKKIIMEDFLFIFRMEYAATQPTAAQREESMKRWQDWLGTLAAQNHLTNAGSRLMQEGKVVKPKNIVTDGPFMEMKEAVGGYSIIKAESLAQATELAKGCPIFLIGGNVEVRQIASM